MKPTEHVDEIMGKWREEAEQGRLVDPKTVLESHPEHAEELAGRFAAQALVDDYFADADGLPLVTPERIGDYRIIGELGRGGMGVVYEAIQESMRRKVALKVLYPTIATTVRTRKRFEREARLTGRLHHSNVVTVYAMGQDNGNFYFAMELIEGRPLDEVIGHLRSESKGEPTSQPLQAIASDLRGRGCYERIAEKIAGVADALHLAHSHGVIHRDVKPSNLVLAEGGELKLTDFGLAQLTGENLGITRTGEVLGTPLYMSPEQVRAHREGVDQRTDVYSLGATLYEMLSLVPVHDGADVGSLCSQILTEAPRALRARVPEVPKDLATIVHKALQKERCDRYASAGDMASDLRAFAEGRAISARPLGVVQRSWRAVKRRRVRSALVALVLLLAGTAFWLKAETDLVREQQRRARYEDLLKQAHEAAMLASFRPSRSRQLDFQVEKADALFSRVIEIDPGRVEGWLGRALIPARSRESCLEDIDRASAVGLAPRTTSLARVFVLGTAGATPLAADTFDMLESRPLDLFLAGSPLVNGGRPLEAIEFLTAAIEAAPADHFVRRRALVWRAYAYQEVRAWADALGDFTILHELSPHSPQISILLANAWHRVGQQERANKVFRKALAQTRRLSDESDGEEIWALILDFAERAEHGPWMAELLQSSLAARPDSPILLAFAAEDAMRASRVQQAVNLIERAVALAGPDHRHRRRVLFDREHILLLRDLLQGSDLGSPERIAALRELVKEYPRDVDFYRLLAERLKLDHPAERTRLLEEALEISPHDMVLLGTAGESAKNEGRVDVAESYFLRALSAAPNEPMIFRSLADLEQYRRNYRGALDWAEKGLAKRPGFPHLLVTKAQALAALGRPEEGLKAIADLTADDYHEHGTGFHPLEHYVRGTLMLQVGNPTGALEAFRKLAAADEGPQGLLRQAAVLRVLGRLDEASEAFDLALRRRAHRASLLMERAWEALRLGRMQAARTDLDEAARISAKGAEITGLAATRKSYRLLSGDQAPATPDDHVHMAEITSWVDPKRAYEHMLAALKAEAVRADLGRAHLYNAACYAARASRASKHADERVTLEKQAMDLLTEYRDRWERHLEALGKRDPKASAQAQAAWTGMCQHAHGDPDLSTLRDRPAFKALFAKAASAASEPSAPGK